ncbi:hypothetical protein J437_LFUL008194, partial [Ladona fulva]
MVRLSPRNRSCFTLSSGLASGKASGGTSGSSGSTGAVTTANASGNAASATPKPDPKPVECNLCHRKFKNIPALNGHMRLHGGYFKKDSESKKSERKESSGPPLQTASVSVRALIGEKIIQKRITTNPQLVAQIQAQAAQVQAQAAQAQAQAQAQVAQVQAQAAQVQAQAAQFTQGTFQGNSHSAFWNAVGNAGVAVGPQTETSTTNGNGTYHSPLPSTPPHYPATPPTPQQQDTPNGFAVPAAPAITQTAPSEQRARRNSDSAAAVTAAVQTQLDRRSVSPSPNIKRLQRTESDPGGSPGMVSPAALAAFSGDEDGGLGAYARDEDDTGGYFSPSLQEDVFTQVSVQETMLLHGVDPAQLAETIQ